jgi:hypothetical protein
MFQPFKNLSDLIIIKPNERWIKAQESINKFINEIDGEDPYSEDTVAILDDLKKARRGLQVNFINY